MNNPMPDSNQRILDGTTWAEFCDKLKEAGAVIEREGSPSDAFNRAEGYRYLTRLFRAALQTFIENADPGAPTLQRVVHETAKLGADNPDNYYQNATVSGAYEYRITGTRGTVHYLSFSTQSGGYGEGGSMPPTGFLDGSILTMDGDGHFEIAVSCRERPGNWLPMAPDTGTLIVRQTFLDRETERPADLRIERVDAPHEPRPVTPEAIDTGLVKVANLVQGAATLFATWAEGFMAHENELPPFDTNLAKLAGGDPNIVYYHSYWRLGPQQALVIEVTPPPCAHWNFQLNNHWMESLDYRYFPITVNKHSARYRDDGSVRIVVAHHNPGVDNWIDTAGHDCGTMCFRWIGATDHPQPQTRVVSVSDLA